MYIEDLALDILQWLMSHKTKPNETKRNQTTQNQSFIIRCILVSYKGYPFLWGGGDLTPMQRIQSTYSKPLNRVVCKCVWVCLYTCRHDSSLYVNFTYNGIKTHKFTYTHIYVYIHTQTHTHTHTYIYIYIYIYKHFIYTYWKIFECFVYHWNVEAWCTYLS